MRAAEPLECAALPGESRSLAMLLPTLERSS